MEGFYVEPGGRLVVVEGDESAGGLEQFDLGLVVNWGVQVSEEGDIRLDLVA